jgi:hypothetical protein
MLALRLAATPDMQGMQATAGAATKTTTDQERTARIG